MDLAATASQTSVAQGGSGVFSYAITNATATAVSGDLFFSVARGGSTVAQGTVRSGTVPAG